MAAAPRLGARHREGGGAWSARGLVPSVSVQEHTTLCTRVRGGRAGIKTQPNRGQGEARGAGAAGSRRATPCCHNIATTTTACAAPSCPHPKCHPPFLWRLTTTTATATTTTATHAPALFSFVWFSSGWNLQPPSLVAPAALCCCWHSTGRRRAVRRSARRRRRRLRRRRRRHRCGGGGGLKPPPCGHQCTRQLRLHPAISGRCSLASHLSMHLPAWRCPDNLGLICFPVSVWLPGLLSP